MTLAERLIRSKFSLQNLTGQCRICLAFAQLHHLAFEKIQRGGFAGFEIGYRTWICHNGFIAEFFNRRRVADLCQAFFLNDSFWRFAGVEHLRKNLLRGGTADGFAFNKINQFQNCFGFEFQIRVR